MHQVEGCPAPMTTGNREVSGEGSTSVGPKGPVLRVLEEPALWG